MCAGGTPGRSGRGASRGNVAAQWAAARQADREKGRAKDHASKGTRQYRCAAERPKLLPAPAGWCATGKSAQRRCTPPQRAEGTHASAIEKQRVRPEKGHKTCQTAPSCAGSQPHPLNGQAQMQMHDKHTDPINNHNGHLECQDSSHTNTDPRKKVQAACLFSRFSIPRCRSNTAGPPRASAARAQ